MVEKSCWCHDTIHLPYYSCFGLRQSLRVHSYRLLAFSKNIAFHFNFLGLLAGVGHSFLLFQFSRYHLIFPLHFSLLFFWGTLLFFHSNWVWLTFFFLFFHTGCPGSRCSIFPTPGLPGQRASSTKVRRTVSDFFLLFFFFYCIILRLLFFFSDGMGFL